ncbi:MAG TPA: ubiquitin--protein ligase [Clostridium sp.]|nr:ubiquitin--protein ligase [Clostridium sp.]
MSDLEKKLAVYNGPVNFKVKFTAARLKDIYKSFIIEEKLHKALTFNLRNSNIKADGELIVGNFSYDDKEKMLKIEIDNPSEDKDSEIEITIATNITDLAAIVESNYVISNVAYIKIKGYEEYEGLTTKSNLIEIEYSSIKIDIHTEKVDNIIPAIDGEIVYLKASFNMLNTEANYSVNIKNYIGENLRLEEGKSFVAINGVKSDFVKFNLVDNVVNVSIDNSKSLKNKKIDILICAKIQNAETIGNTMSNEYSISINNVECCRDTINIKFIKPISDLINTIETIN